MLRNARELSSAGRASALQAEGHRFEPYSSHQTALAANAASAYFFLKRGEMPVSDLCGRVVQLVRTPACHAGGRGFEPHSGRQFASVAQSVEQRTENPRVDGSIPSGSTIICGFSSSGRAPPCQGGGSEFEPRNPLQQPLHETCSGFFCHLTVYSCIVC